MLPRLPEVLLPELVRWVLAALTVYRLSELVALDDGPFQFFARLRRWAGVHPDDLIRENLAELLHCPYCLGVWFGAVVVVLAVWPTWPGDLALGMLGLAGAQSVLSNLTNGRNDASG
jgi:hypothetical protein